MNLIVILFGVLLTVSIASTDDKYKISYNENKPSRIHYVTRYKNGFMINEYRSNYEFDNSLWLAKAFIDKNNYNITGWTTLEIETNEAALDVDQAFAAGLLEAHLTKDLISMHILNMDPDNCNGTKDECKQLYDFIGQNFKFLTKMILEHPDDPYWHQVNLVLTQFSGLYHGLKGLYTPRFSFDDLLDMFEKKEKLFMKIFLLQQIADVDEVLFKIKKIVDPFWASACSALIKVLPDNSDILVSHNTWFAYEMMLRIAKHYKFHYHLNNNYNIPVATETISFSSYPGVLGSFDDFYVTSSNLAIMETTIGNSNVELWDYVTTQTVPYWIRNLVANRLSRTGVEWAKWYSMYNSGTYNNQWMIIDYKQFIPNKPLNDGLFILLEQIPGNVMWKDLTSVLRDQLYWASYNLPYFDEIANISGNYDNLARYGETVFSHEHSARASIFRRDHDNVHDLVSLMKLMRYNNFTKEPFSRCNCNPPYSAFLTISSRADLNAVDGTYEYHAFSHRDEGALDLKVTSSSMSQNLEFIGINGPTYEDVPPFVWSQTDFGKTTNHFGHPDKFEFKPFQFKWNL